MTDKSDDNFFVIEPDRLIEQWSTFARDYWQYGHKMADAREEYEQACRLRDVVEAELDRDIRANPDDYGLSPGSRGVTEKMVEHTILLQRRYDDASKNVIAAKHALDVCQAWMAAMDAMKKGLESTTYLQQSAYYAEPRARGEAGRQMASAQLDNTFSKRKRAQ